MMAGGSIPVDLLNPGQVFACVGFMEAAEVICGDVVAGFDWSEPGDIRFVIRCSADANPFAAVLGFVERAEVRSVAPYGSGNRTESWGVRTEVLPAGAPFPYPDPNSPATLPAVLSDGQHRVVIDHWADGKGLTGRDNVKFWAGAAGYPGAALVRDVLELVQAGAIEAVSDPFGLSALQTSSFRFDWRRDYIPIDAGFSLNSNHPVSIQPRGYPFVELMAAIGLTHGRPVREEKLAYRYGIAGRANPGTSEELALLPPILVRGALGCAALPFPTRTFRMNLNWPGQEGQARSITTVAEEAR